MGPWLSLDRASGFGEGFYFPKEKLSAKRKGDSSLRDL